MNRYVVSGYARAGGSGGPGRYSAFLEPFEHTVPGPLGPTFLESQTQKNAAHGYA